MSVLQSEFGDVLVIFFHFEILTYECHATDWIVFETTSFDNIFLFSKKQLLQIFEKVFCF